MLFPGETPGRNYLGILCDHIHVVCGRNVYGGMPPDGCGIDLLVHAQAVALSSYTYQATTTATVGHSYRCKERDWTLFRWRRRTNVAIVRWTVWLSGRVCLGGIEETRTARLPSSWKRWPVRDEQASRAVGRCPGLAAATDGR